ncbi:MAG: nucleotidyltransferase [Ruminococcaceae bacterium]|nr:nucleotidyltransferase [Oscillospiraceae bacterium]
MCVYSFEEIAERVRPVAEKYGLKSVYLFGSYARGDADDDSDVDLLVDAENVHGFRFFGMYDEFCTALEKQVDMVTLRTLEQERGTSYGKRFVQAVELDRRRLI